jgi:hypothetical protein
MFVDPEEPNSEEIKIKIEVKNDFDYIHRDLKPSIYKIVTNILSDEILEKILIKLERL